LTASSALPDVPTFLESGVQGMIVNNWFGVFGPARLPKEIVAKMHKAAVDALNAPDVRSKFTMLSLDVVASTPHEFDAHLKAELEKWGKVVKAAGIKPE
jgi:tripartite-type tricarboxylate transporter receptor subunit TctC